MYLFQLKKIAFTFCLVFAVFTANAAGLGNLNLMSGLGEPLNAEIELLSVKADELAAVQAMIASEQAYAEQSLEKPSSHNGIKVEVAKNSRGEPILKLFSSQPMSDAFLDMLIQVEWPTGRLVKEYTVLLDPPGYEQKIATTPTVKLPTPAQVLDKNNTEPVTSEANSVDSKPEVKPVEVDTKPIAKTQETEQKQPATQVSSEQLAREKAKINYKFKENSAKQNGDIKEKAASSGREESQQTHATARGDTLYAIARENQPEGVSLEQMLVGLYQANPDAFINRNINQLKVGQILNVPSQESLEKISPTQAKRQYKAQSAHWNTYKNKLAGLVRQSKASAEESSAQQSGGKVVAAEDKSLPVNTGIKDVVKLSAGDAKSHKSGDKALQDKVNALQEEVTAKDGAVKEAQSRTSDLEKQVAEMQKLLALKNDAMLKLQQNADATSKQMKQTDSATATPQAVVKPETKSGNATAQIANPSTVGSDTANKVDADETKGNVETTPKENVSAETVPAEVTPPAVTPPQTEAPKIPLPNKIEAPQATPAEPIVEKPSFITSLLKRLTGFTSGMQLNPVSLLGLLAIPVLGGVWWMLRQKRKKNLASFEDGIMSPSVSDMTVNTVFGNTTGGTVEAGDTSFLTDFSQSAVGGMIDANDVDPIAEAEVYMAYGRDAQAEEILKDAIAKEPKRYELHLKLLEIYQTSQNTSAFEAIAGELYANLGGSDQNWLKVAQMGVKLDPNNPLYQSSGQTPVKVTNNEKSTDVVDSSALSSSLQKSPQATTSAESDYDMLDLNFETPSLDFDMSKSSSSEQKKASDEAMPFGNTIAFGNTISSFDTTGFDNTIVADPVAKSESISEMNITVSEDIDTPASNALSLDTNEFVNTMTPKSLDLPTIDFVGGNKTEITGDYSDEDTVSQGSTAMSSSLDATEMFKSVPNLNFDVADEGVASKADLSESLNNSNADIEDGMTVSTVGDVVLSNTSDTSKVSDTNMTTEASEEVETKLDLIKAYIDMEDTVGAKELIEEVLKEGAESHRKRANELLAQIS